MPANPNSEPVVQTVADIDALVLGLAPATAGAALYGAMSHSMGILFENSVANQARQAMLGNMLVAGAILQTTPITDMAAVAATAAVDPDADLNDLLSALNQFGAKDSKPSGS
ncbi:killing trait domain-containing protein [Roseibium hamelinense]|uniref:Killing trait domain-containing protein n=1 Tax=Roseibium hamelinense TaxID=150831 RepID=A0A562T9I8_9HYPH|nr:RebB family R body protein [Roseibium hamelinense]MTI45344.1 R body protein RebB-like protein [Roseibium hamelinense]TWI90289.1 killing trait domain-containing protein [Roseibium hamelinense]